MNQSQKMKKLLQQIQVVRPPKHRLSTFGTSRIEYQLVTDVAGLSDRSRLRLGVVTAEKPAIITPQSLAERFQGFGEKSQDVEELLTKQYGNVLRGLEYQFRNETVSTRIELAAPESFVNRLTREFDESSDNYNTAIIRGTDKLWEMSIMKFIVEETLASFSVNLQELQDRGFFEEEDRDEKRHRSEVEYLLKIAQTDRSKLPLLGKKLKDYGMFEDYQDAFFRLVR